MDQEIARLNDPELLERNGRNALTLVKNGPLRVVPDSHRSGVLTDAEIRDLVARSAPRECVAPRGSVVAMRPLTVHASSKAATAARRRVLHIEYAASLNLGKGLELAVG